MPYLNRRVLAAVLVLHVGSAAGSAQVPHAQEQVKAAFLYNFTKFIDWPAAAFSGSSTPFHVCVQADDQFVRELRAILRGEQVQGRPIEVSENAPDLKSCHLVYFGSRDEERTLQRLPELRLLPVLTVGEGPRFLEQGGLIAFQVEQDRVRFDINKRRADATGLIVSSKLLRVARLKGAE
jgi:hypothetical protein